ncbi:MAG: hypothetical protein ACTSX4_01580 [Candidatus Helarchaeota archaeon]
MISENKFESIQEKKEKINKTMKNFENQVLSKIGDILLFELKQLREEDNQIEYVEEEKSEVIKIKILSEIRLIYLQIQQREMLIETAILYVLYNMDQLDDSLKLKYEKNLQDLASFVSNISFSIMDGNSRPDLYQEELHEIYSVPNYLKPKFEIIKTNFDVLFNYGIMAILKWLNLLDSHLTNLFNIKEKQFMNYISEYLMNNQIK